VSLKYQSRGQLLMSRLFEWTAYSAFHQLDARAYCLLPTWC